MGLELDVTVPIITVFLQGILSFFSPCVLPIIPLYMGYLSSGSFVQKKDGTEGLNQKKVLLNTLFFVLGISFAFLILGLGFSALGQFFTSNQGVFARIGGILVILLGLIQLGIFPQLFHGKEWKLPIRIDALRMNPIIALAMGFTFSFAWTPCVGPALSTVLIMISGTGNTAQGMVLMGIYTLGFVLPFLVVGIFTTKCLYFFRKYGNVVKYTVKIGAFIMILMGLMMFTGTMNRFTSYLSAYDVPSDTQGDAQEELEGESEQLEAQNKEEVADVVEPDIIPALQFTMEDQYGNVHTLDEYKGKVIFLNIWATWCPPCKAEMPDIQKLYEEYGLNEEDVIVLGVAFPNDENTYTQDGSKEEITSFLAENEYTYPTLMDTKGELLFGYGISSFPTTLMIDTQGNVFGAVPGMMTYDIMESIVEQTIAGSPEVEEDDEQEAVEVSGDLRSEVSLIMVGDMLFHMPVVESGYMDDGTLNYDHIFAHTNSYIEQADIAIVNQETILGGEELGYSGYPCFNSPFEVGDAMVEAGFDLVLHATNHTLDMGTTGLLNCLEYWETSQPDVEVIGAYNSQEAQDTILIYEENGIRIAFLNYTYGTNGIPLPEDMPYAVNLLEEEFVIAQLQQAEEEADFTVVMPHWGTEYQLDYSSYQSDWCAIFLEYGADLVIGAHPHVIQPIEWYRDDTGHEMLVYYSLGNFINATSTQDSTIGNRMIGGMADVVIRKDEESGETYISEYGVIPLVTHYEFGQGNMTCYPLEDYTDELAEKTETIRWVQDFSADYGWDLAESVFGEELINGKVMNTNE